MSLNNLKINKLMTKNICEQG